LSRVEVSQVCMTSFDNNESSYVGGTQLFVGGSLLVIGIGLFLLRQRLKSEEGATMLSSLKSTMGKFGGVLAANTRLSGNSNSNHANENVNIKTTHTHSSHTHSSHTHGSGKRGHAHGSDGEDEDELELKVTNATHGANTSTTRDDNDVVSETGMGHPNNAVGISNASLNLTKRGNHDGPQDKKTRKTKSTSPREETAQDFVTRVLEGMGYPAFTSEKYCKKLTDQYITTLIQLKELEKKDWKQLTFPDEIVTELFKELNILEEQSQHQKKNTKRTH